MANTQTFERLVLQGQDLGVRVKYEQQGHVRYADVGLDEIKPYIRPEHIASLGVVQLLEDGDEYYTEFERSTGITVEDLSDNLQFCKQVGSSLIKHYNRGLKAFNIKASVRNSTNVYNFELYTKNALMARKKAKEQVASNLGVALDSVKILQCVVKV